LLLDKTGTITLGNRRASEFLPVNGVSEEQLADAAQLSSLADETAEGRSIVILAKERFNLRERAFQQSEVTFIDFSAKTRMSGIDYRGDEIRKGAADTIKKYVQSNGEQYPAECDEIVDKIARAGGTPLVVVKNNRVMG
ncbi:potassium-transporting ATPase subunit B, partial [Enterococcus sp. S181_ASV_20]|nr:potassium-transporting ATPase subunit B [Enterococcus sp. S181_ASV_20]